MQRWWELHRWDLEGYEEQKQAFLERMMHTAEQVLPGLRQYVLFSLVGMPVSLQRFSGRLGGGVSGHPRTHLLRTCAPRLGRSMWLVGDNIFPGRSIAGVALEGMRGADAVLRSSRESGFSLRNLRRGLAGHHAYKPSSQPNRRAAGSKP